MDTTKEILGCYSLDEILTPHISEKLNATATVAQGTYEAVVAVGKWLDYIEKRQRRERWVKGK